MEMNVCSRRVHDGYATIRTRGRNRPRAVYRSDSEELLKEANGPYAPPEMSSILPQAGVRVPRWCDAGKDSFAENYGTLKSSPRRVVSLDEGQRTVREQKVPILNTFVASKTRRFSESARPSLSKDVEEAQDGANPKQTYDTVPTENSTTADSVDFEVDKTALPNTCENADESNRNNKRTTTNRTRQPIYAIPNVPRLNNKPPRPPRDHGLDGNYVPSGDLYRSTARYIEDLNKNIAKIDKNYAEMRSGSNRNSAYGIINKIAKTEVGNAPKNVYGTHKKRDMAPMPPISPNFGEPFEDREFDFKVPKNTARARPNSYGKLPPKVLPRSSSIEGPSSPSRNSNGSSSSVKSTESLYAISEALTGLPKSRVTFREPNISRSNSGRFHDASESCQTLPINRPAFKNRKNKTDVSSGKTNNGIGRSATLGRRQDQRSMRKNLSEENIVGDVFFDNVSSFSNTECSRNVAFSESRRRVVVTVNRRHSARSHEDILHDTLDVEAKYGTLPHRKPRMSPRAMHKSSEDVLDSARDSGIDTGDLGRGYKSSMDVRDHSKYQKSVKSQLPGTTWRNAVPICLMDATDVILNGQLQRSRELIDGENDLEEDANSTDTVDHYQMLQARFRGDAPDLSGTATAPKTRKSVRARTRHNSLELDADASMIHSNAMNYATLPRRRGTANKSEQGSVDCPNRLSGTVPVLEPLYEHAVSDPIKPRNNPDNVIPWWELATRKYRHRSCPSLQVNRLSNYGTRVMITLQIVRQRIIGRDRVLLYNLASLTRA